MPALVLASSSPRRRELLGGLGLVFAVRAPDVDETLLPGEAPTAHVLRLARAKAEAIAHPGELVLGADTVVVLDGEVFGKPAGPPEARRMLARLSGREHEVLTGVAVHDPDSGSTVTALESSRVRFAVLDEARIVWYVGTGEPLDRAGAYAIQGLGALLVEAVVGNYANVVGLPLPLVERLVRQAGYDLLRFRPVSPAASRPRS